jgi:hypothetical protein
MTLETVMLSVTNKRFMLSAIMLSAVMLNVVAPIKDPKIESKLCLL